MKYAPKWTGRTHANLRPGEGAGHRIPPKQMFERLGNLGGCWCGGRAQKSRKGKAWEVQYRGPRKKITLTLYSDPGENKRHLAPIW